MVTDRSTSTLSYECAVVRTLVRLGGDLYRYESDLIREGLVSADLSAWYIDGLLERGELIGQVLTMVKEKYADPAEGGFDTAKSEVGGGSAGIRLLLSWSEPFVKQKTPGQSPAWVPSCPRVC